MPKKALIRLHDDAGMSYLLQMCFLIFYISTLHVWACWVASHQRYTTCRGQGWSRQIHSYINLFLSILHGSKKSTILTGFSTRVAVVSNCSNLI